MNVFVTGGAGYVGSITTKLLLDQGHEVTVFDNLSAGHMDALDSRCRFIEGDLQSKEDIHLALEDVCPDAIIHFAAYTIIGESMADPEKYWENNLTGGTHLINAAVHHGIKRFVFSSTCATYGTPNILPITEDTPQYPDNPYSESEQMLETVLEWAHYLHGLPYASLRYSNAGGADGELGEDHTPETHLIPTALSVAMGQTDHVDIYGTDFTTPDGTCIRDYIHVKDIAQAHLLALESNVSGAFNLGSGQGYSVLEVIDAIAQVTNCTIPICEGERHNGDAPALVASYEKAKDELGWEPAYSDLKTIIRDAWEWKKAHPLGYGIMMMAQEV